MIGFLNAQLYLRYQINRFKMVLAAIKHFNWFLACVWYTRCN